MHILTFNYTKTDGKKSKRVIAVHNTPQKLYAGTDISTLSMEDQALYAIKVQKAKDAYLEVVKHINDEFDLNYNFRQFKPELMSEIVEEHI